LTQVTAAFYHSRNANKVALWTMAEIIEYRGYRLSVEPHAPGSKILIFPPGSSLPLPTILFQRNRTRLDGLIKDAKDIVDDHLAMSAKNDAPKGAPSWWRRFSLATFRKTTPICSVPERGLAAGLAHFCPRRVPRHARS
jgi:hypothetical protein